MNIEALFLFLILLLGLVLCSFLGVKEGFDTPTQSNANSGATTSSSPVAGSYSDYYNHFTGSGSTSQLQNGMVFTDPSGNTLTVVVNSDGTHTLKLADVKMTVNMVLTQQTPTTFAAPYGGVTAVIVTGTDGQLAVNVTIQGHVIVFSQTSAGSKTTTSSTQYYGSTGSPIQSSPYALAYQGPNGNTAYYAQGPNGNAVAGYNYSSSLPQGIPKHQIPPGQEDLYILKSEIVPPVCPACPSSTACPRQEKCPPCPACARCPEPSFECKKVPNYNAINNDSLPTPVLNDFSQFGM
jgi:hypothetical protein